jgi:hypothetical protein
MPNLIRGKTELIIALVAAATLANLIVLAVAWH